MKTFIYFKSGNVYQIDLDSVRDQDDPVNLLDWFWEQSDAVLQATYLTTDHTTGQLLFKLSEVESIEQGRY